MSKKLFCCLTLVWTIFIAASASAQKFSELDKSPCDISYARGKDKEPLIRVIYGRPQKKGRTVFGELEPYGKVWRTGANESTEIKFYKDAILGGKEVKAGTYSLFSIPGKDKWTVIINSDTDAWGAYSYNMQKDVARIDVKPQTLPNELEILNIVFKETEKGPDLIIAWDKTMVEVPVEFSEKAANSTNASEVKSEVKNTVPANK